MINIVLKSGKNGELCSCRVAGHAGCAGKGEDVVCAAVSILVRVAVLQLQEWALENEKLKVSLDYREEGVVDFSVLQHDRDLNSALIHLFSFLRLGFESISCEYGNSLKLEMS